MDRFHVSPQGDDLGDGSESRPFRTLERAKEAVRFVNRDMRQDLEVVLQDGLYGLDHPLHLSSIDSGSNGHRIVWRAENPGKAVISGGMRVTGWTVCHKEGKETWIAHCQGIPYSRHLFADGKRLSRPGTEKKSTVFWNPVKDQEFVFDRRIEEVETYQGVMPVFEGYASTHSEMAGWRNLRDIEFMYEVKWSYCICPVEDVKPLEGGRVFVRMRMPCFRDCQIKAGVQIGGPNRIENVFELLDKPEEWYLDRRTRTIHYVPRPGQDKEGTCFVMPGLEKLLIIQGTSSDRVHGISFEGIVFADTTFLRPGISGHAEVQSNLIKDPANDLLSHSSYFGMPAAVTLGGVEDVSIRSCGFTRLGSSAIDIGKGSRRVAVEGNVIQDISGSGIQIGGFDFSDAHPADEEDVVERIAVMDNYIHHIGAEFKGSTGIIAGYARHLDIAHNEIHHVPYIGISVGWGWGYCDPGVERILRPAPSYYPVFTTPTIMEDNSIQYNWIHHAMQVMYDGGGIYTLSRQPGSRIAGNLLHDNSDCVGVLTKAEPYIKHVTEPFIKERPQGYPGGIYLDEGSEGFEVTDNVFYNVAVPINANPIRGDEGGNHIHGNRMGLPEEVPSREEMPEQPGFRDRLQQVLNRGGSCPD